MTVLKKILGIQYIYSRRHWSALFIEPFFIIAVIIVISSFFEFGIQGDGLMPSASVSVMTDRVVGMLVILVILVYLRLLIISIYTSVVLRRRKHVPAPFKTSNIRASAVNTELDVLDESKYIRAWQDGGALDARFNFYRKTKHGDQLYKQALYTVLEFRLRRRLPHVLFDSKAAKGNQFEKYFIRAQRLSMDVYVDDYFDVYAPEGYQIDTLSFITPEVLYAMVEAKDYDFEIVNDSLLCFAPILNESDLDIAEHTCRKVYASLNDHIDNYRDNRLKGKQRKHGVTDFAKQLLESPLRFYVPALISGLLTLVGLMLLLQWRQYGGDVRIVLYPGIFFAGYFGKILKIKRRNNQLIQNFKGLSERADV